MQFFSFSREKFEQIRSQRRHIDKILKESHYEKILYAKIFLPSDSRRI